ncbi:aromatic ring-hydroxylating oxygenase subunit alpha [Novosphingobium mangrovi (ex Huang et al. 2023)]|uniref:Aromatic ring-hydroxylating dioxygenase subunit alpha n=1 Tax=Novosphingobium mangrovi (ex Huang et al. 2023) TaxID=2976432 RepID=A0ABT2I5T7_9SPHN|nr:aromatic ring-hydroxylating dioxygenase subunit alpha [Novosphingobium mangrovi (ex Huang et al. 2023)]MCT2400177.1 aromatic ring-hydroxylating dioxygenase subunit alpha [Novosphingobium mangrovi (ex Huang et al. 2023)]
MNKPEKFEPNRLTAQDMDDEVLSTYPTDAFLSKDYLQAEKTLLWPKVWQMVERETDLPNPGDWMTYDVAEESIVVLRKDDGTLRAFHNVCPHRGRQLVSVPDMLPRKVHDVRGNNRKNFICGFHGWTFDTDGNNTYILDPQDWQNKLTPEMTCLSEVQVDTWGGYIYINMDPDCVPLKEWMGRAGEILDHFELEKMRYKWRQWAIYDCNWKTAIEAFLEPYHVAGTHTQLLAYGDYYALSKQYGLHSVSSYDTREEKFQMSESAGTTRAGKGDDARVSTYELIKENYETINYAASTETLVNAASRLVDELPETATPTEIIAHWIKSAKADDAARGVIWPEVPPEIKKESGLAWGLFPNQNILHGETFALCYRVRPYGDDPNKCIFESYALERFPEGEEPETEWVYADPTGENWGSVLAQDFSNMQFVQKGMKSSGFRGPLPNPHQEQKVINLHRNLANFMEGCGAPTKLGI